MRPFFPYALSVLFAKINLSYGDMFDVVIPPDILAAPQTCVQGCAVWSDLAGSYNTVAQKTVDSLWVNISEQQLAGAACAIPGNFAVPEGALCYCAGTQSSPVSTWGYCTDPDVPTPQQVNLQYGVDGEHIQVAFVTLDHGSPLVAPPRVELCDAIGCLNVTGTTTRAPEPQNPTRVYSFHFVPLPSPLKPSTVYTYRARGGTELGAWGSWMSMKTRSTADSPLRFALFGDQGVYPFNNMGNLMADRVRA
jgi:hypothetical protein